MDDSGQSLHFVNIFVRSQQSDLVDETQTGVCVVQAGRLQTRILDLFAKSKMNGCQKKLVLELPFMKQTDEHMQTLT